MAEYSAVLKILRARLQNGRKQPKWNTVLQFHLDQEQEKEFHVMIVGGEPSVAGGTHPMPRTVLTGTLAAAQRVFAEGQDITHQIATGGLNLVAGDYYDLIMLGKSLSKLSKIKGVKA